MSVLREVSIANRHPRLRLDRRAVARAIHVLDTHYLETPAKRKAKIKNQKSSAPSSATSVPPGELSLVFLTDSALAQLHADFLDDPTPTDVITFEGDPTLGTAGEICVSADAALRHVNARAPSLNSQPSTLNSPFSTELTLYLVHGWLHLAGYDDLVPVKKRAMRRAESRAMRILQTKGCRPTFRLLL